MRHHHFNLYKNQNVEGDDKNCILTWTDASVCQDKKYVHYDWLKVEERK